MITKEHALQIYFDHEKDMIKITDEPLSETTQIYGYGKDLEVIQLRNITLLSVYNITVSGIQYIFHKKLIQ